MIATCEETINDEQLLLQRMIMVDDQRTSVDLYMENIDSISPENIIFKIQENIKEKLAYQLVLDMFLIANLSACKTRRTFASIANISNFLYIDVSELKMISTVARMILTQKIDECIRTMTINNLEKINELFGYYFEEISVWKELLFEKRKTKIERNQGIYTGFYKKLGNVLDSVLNNNLESEEVY